MARWDQMTVARRQRAKQERKDDEEWLKTEDQQKPDGYAQMTKTQQRNWRVKQAKKAKWLQTKP